MDSKAVSSEIKQRIWPLLRDGGFDVFSSRTAWRHHADRIDVLSVVSFNSYNAGVIGCTTYSFEVDMGCLLKAIPPHYEPSGVKEKAGQSLPQSYNCHFRSRLRRTFEQPELKEKHIWYIDPAGKYLGWAITDVQRLIVANALPWFDCFSDPQYALKVVLNEEEQEDFWGFGQKQSPRRHYFTGYLALKASQTELARHHLALALSSHCFKTVEDRLSLDIRKTGEVR